MRFLLNFQIFFCIAVLTFENFGGNLEKDIEGTIYALLGEEAAIYHV